MKTGKIVKKVGKFSSALALGLVMPALSAACDYEKEEKIDTNKPNHQKPVSGKINYVAIGDDYAIGNNNSDNAKNKNFFDNQTNEVYGLSYASYLANSILLLDDEKTTLNKYDNLGISYSTTKDWLELLNPKQYSNFNSLSKTLEINKNLNLVNNNLTSNEVISKIKDSNLITVSLGLNDIFKKHELLSLALNNFENENQKNDYLNSYKQIISIRLNEFKKNYLNVVKEIKSINPEININLTGFISPLLHPIKMNVTEGIKLIYEITEKLNKTISDVANETQINYYSLDNKNYLLSNVSKFSTDFFSTLPNNNAYKKLAQDIFSKMSISSSEYKRLFQTEEKNQSNIAIEFSKKATTIKSLILGIVGTDVDTYRKPYPFERNNLNSEITDSEENNIYSQKLLTELKNYFYTLEFKDKKIFIFNIFNILGIHNDEVRQWFNNIYEEYNNLENKEPLLNFFDQFFDSEIIQNLLNQANLEISELIAKKSHENIKFEEIRNKINEKLRNKENIYYIFKSVLNNNYLSNEKNKEFANKNIKNLLKLVFSSNVVNKIFPQRISAIWNNAVKNDQISSKFDELINKLVENFISNHEEYFKSTSFEKFINSVFSDAKNEIILLFSSVINWIKTDEILFDEILKRLVENLKDIYKIKEERTEDIYYFIKHTIINIDNFKYSYEFLELFVETILNLPESNETLESATLIKHFVKGLIFNTSKANSNNRIFFNLISNIPSVENLDEEKYKNGMLYLGVGLVDAENYLKADKISGLLDENLRSSILKFFENITNNVDNELNENGKEYIKKLISLLIDDISSKNSLLNQLIDKLGNYIVIYPLTNYIKKTGFEKQILDSNPQIESIEEFIRNGYKNIYSSINNTNVINEVKNLAFDLIDNGNLYQKDNFLHFTVSILKRIDENGIVNIVKTLLNELATENNGNLFTDILATYLNSHLNIQLNNNERQLVSTYIKNFLETVPRSELLNYFIDNFKEIINSIDLNAITDFQKLGDYLRNELSKLLSNSINSNVIQKALDLLSLKNSASKNGFNHFINVASIFLKNDDILNLILEKINLRQLISKLPEYINVSTLPEEIQQDVSQLIQNTTDIAIEKWDTQISSKIKELIKNSVSNEKLKKAQNLNELLSLVFSENKEFLKDFLNEVINSLVLSSEQNKDKIVDIATYFLQQKLNYKNVSQEEKNNVKSILKKGIDFANKNKLFNSVVNGLLDTIEFNISNFGIQFSKYSWNKIGDFIKFEDGIDFLNLIEEFLLDTISKDEVKTLLKIAFINIPTILSLIKIDNLDNNQSGGNESDTENVNNETANAIDINKVFELINKILNRLSADNRKELIPYVVDGIYELKENKQIKSILLKLLKNQLKNLNIQNLKIISQDENPLETLPELIINKIYELILSSNNKEHFVKIFEGLFVNEEDITIEPKTLILKLLKNIENNKIDEFINNNLNVLLSDGQTTELISKSIIVLLKTQLSIDFSQEEITEITSYLNLLLKSLPNNSLFNELKTTIYNKIKELGDDSTFEDLQNKFNESLKSFLTFDKEKMIKIFNLLIIKSNDTNVDQQAKLIKVFSILLNKQQLRDYIWTNFDLKTLIVNSIKNIEVQSLTIQDETKNQLKNLITKLSEFVDSQFDELIKQNINELIEKILLPEVINETPSFEELIKKFLSTNKEWLINKIDSIFNSLLSKNEANDLKDSLASFLVEFISEKLNNLTFENQQKDEFKNFIKKLLNSIPNWGLTKGITKSAVDLVIKNVNENNLNFEEYDFNGLIDIIQILNSTNITKIQEFLISLESKDLSTVILLIINNFEKIENLFVVSENNSNPSAENNEESNTNNKNKHIIQFNEKEGILLNIEVVFKLIKSSLSILEGQDRETIKTKIPELINKIKQSEKIKNYVGSKLDIITKLILNEDANATDFASKTKEKIINILFEEETTKDFLVNIINSLIDLDKNALSSINTMNELVRKLLRDNKDNITNLIKKVIEKANEDQDYIAKMFSLIISVINKNYSFDATSDEINNISTLLARIVKNLTDKKITTEVISKLFEGLININIFDNEGHFNGEELKNNVIKSLKLIDWKSLFTSENVEQLFKSIIGSNISKEQLVRELNALYSYLTRNIPKITKNSSNNENAGQPSSNTENNDNNTFLRNIEGTIFNVLVGLNGSLEPNQTEQKEAIIEFAHNVFKDQIKKIDWKAIDQEIIPKDELQIIVDKFLEKPILKTLIGDIVTDFFTKPKIEANNIGEIVNKTLSKVSEKLKTNVTKVIEAVIDDTDLIKIVVKHVMDYLKLENTTDEDTKFLTELIIAIIRDLIKTDYYNRKVVKRSVDHVVNYSKNFTIFEPIKWLNDAINKIKSGFSFADVKIIASFIGNDKAITGERLVKLINLLFGKSNLSNSVIYNALRNINMNPDRTKRTNMQTLNDYISIGSISSSSPSAPSDDPDNIQPELDALKLMDEIFKILEQQYQRSSEAWNDNFKIRSKSEEWKAVYRFKVAMDFIIFEVFGRESLVSERDVSRRKINLYTGVRSILWELQEGTNISAIPFINSKFSGMQRYFGSIRHRRQFTNYVKKETGWGFWKTWHYYDENDYGPESITYIITSSGYKLQEENKLTKFKWKVRENGPQYEISKKEYILLTLKEGGYGKFMKLNDRKSDSEWSELDRVNKQDFY
ncbi:hypothetical protein [Metamycoplasma gateae]|uniref:SGNH hydrolase-type esterase domain-containing protein n=1 Tax=Metamycoplasma gateae TaxID=35769 RepID=A0ABZ2AGF4_9BACT|nr:hypothetical protein V2E26_02245 [Metamycoplasma gateae]